MKYSRKRRGTDLGMIDFDLEDALALIESEEASNFGLHVVPMPQIWRLGLREQYIRAN